MISVAATFQIAARLSFSSRMLLVDEHHGLHLGRIPPSSGFDMANIKQRHDLSLNSKPCTLP